MNKSVIYRSYALLNIIDLQHFVAVVVDDLDGDFAGFGRIEGAAFR